MSSKKYIALSISIKSIHKFLGLSSYHKLTDLYPGIAVVRNYETYLQTTHYFFILYKKKENKTKSDFRNCPNNLNLIVYLIFWGENKLLKVIIWLIGKWGFFMLCIFLTAATQIYVFTNKDYCNNVLISMAYY